MSFDLYFVSECGNPLPTMNALAIWAQTQPYITIDLNGENGTLAYENSDTGVYFILYRSPEAIHLNINYCRPTFFVLETAMVMSSLVAEFALLVIDPDDDDDKTVEYHAAALIEWWQEGNQYGCEVLRSTRQELLWMEETKTTELWHYFRHRSQIVETYDDYFVPKVLVVCLDNKILRGAHLTRPTYYVMPPVDVFWLENDNIVWADRVTSVLKPYLTTLAGFDRFNVISEDTCFDTDVMKMWESMYDDLTPDFTIGQIDGKALSMDGFVDVNL